MSSALPCRVEPAARSSSGARPATPIARSVEARCATGGRAVSRDDDGDVDAEPGRAARPRIRAGRRVGVHGQQQHGARARCWTRPPRPRPAPARAGSRRCGSAPRRGDDPHGLGVDGRLAVVRDQRPALGLAHDLLVTTTTSPSAAGRGDVRRDRAPPRSSPGRDLGQPRRTPLTGSTRGHADVPRAARAARSKRRPRPSPRSARHVGHEQRDGHGTRMPAAGRRRPAGRGVGSRRRASRRAGPRRRGRRRRPRDGLDPDGRQARVRHAAHRRAADDRGDARRPVPRSSRGRPGCRARRGSCRCETTGLDGGSRTTSASAIASRTPGAGLRVLGADRHELQARAPRRAAAPTTPGSGSPARPGARPRSRRGSRPGRRSSAAAGRPGRQPGAQGLGHLARAGSPGRASGCARRGWRRRGRRARTTAARGRRPRAPP